LLSELAQSDRRVGELIGRSQNLVSYHLGRLRAQDVVSMRRSSADRRDTYYSLDLPRCRELLAATHPNAVRAMREHGVDIAGRRAKHLDELAEQRFDYVITLCDRVREVCPELPAHPRVAHWSIPDPARAAEDDAESYPAFQHTATELHGRISFLLDSITHTQATTGS
jgi:hypothetical protein